MPQAPGMGEWTDSLGNLWHTEICKTVAARKTIGQCNALPAINLFRTLDSTQLSLILKYDELYRNALVFNPDENLGHPRTW